MLEVMLRVMLHRPLTFPLSKYLGKYIYRQLIPSMLCAVVDALFDFYRTDPGFRVLWFSRFQSAQMIQANLSHDLADAGMALERLTKAGMRLNHPNPEFPMHLTIGIVDKGLDLAFRLDPAGDPAIVEETKTAVCAYLEQYANATPTLSALGSDTPLRSDSPLRSGTGRR